MKKTNKSSRISLIIFNLLIFIFLLSLCSLDSYGLGISPPKKEFQFIGGSEIEIVYSVFNPESKGYPIEVKVNGDFAEYAEVSREEFFLDAGGVERFTVVFNLPEYFDKPGKIGTKVSVEEKIDEELNGFSARKKIVSMVNILVPYPEKYLEVESLSVPDIKKGARQRITANIVSRGLSTIGHVYGDIQVINPSDSSIIAQMRTQDVYDLQYNQQEALKAEWNAGDLRPAYYNVIFKLLYDDVEEEFTRSFKIGDLNMEIVDKTIDLYAASINEYFLEVKSNWNDPIMDVFYSLELSKDGRVFASTKSPNYDFESWEQKRLKSFLDLRNVEEGNYTAKIDFVYAGKRIQDEFAVTLGEKKAEEAEAEPITEGALDITEEGMSTTDLILYIIVSLIIVNVLWLGYVITRRR